MKQTKKSRGMSILEMVTATAVLMVVVAGVMYFVVSQKKSSQALSGSSECRSYAQSIIDTIGGIGVRDVVLGSLMHPPAGTAPADLTGRSFYSLPLSFSAKLSGVDYFSENIVNGRQIQNSHLVLGAASYVEAVLNSNAAYCSDDGAPIPPGLLQGINAILPGAKVSLKITAIRPSDGSTIACGPIRSAPLGSETIYDAFSAQRGVAFNVAAIVKYNDSQGNLRGCQAEGRFQHQLDNMNTNAPSLFGLRNGANVDMTATGNTSCGPSANYTQVRAVFNVTDIEPGSVPICAETDTVPTAYTPCWNFTYGARQSGNTRVDFTTGATSLMYVRLFGLQADQKYNLHVRTVDTAGNVSANVTSVTFYVDGTRPTLANLRGDGTVIQASVANPGGNKPVNINWSTPWVQCSAGTGTIIGDYVDPLTETLQPCSCAENPNNPNVSLGACTLSSGQCRASVSVGAHTSVGVRLTPKDICGDGTPVTFSYPGVFNFTRPTLTNPAVFNYQASGPYYTITVPPPSAVAPNHYAALCDCNRPPLTEYTGTSSVPCGAASNLSTAAGCTAANFAVALWDICGRGFDLSNSTTIDRTQYQVNGTGPTAACPARTWWQCANPPTSSCDPAQGYYDTMAMCTAAITDPNRQDCVLNGSCYRLRSCSASAYLTRSICESNTSCDPSGTRCNQPGGIRCWSCPSGGCQAGETTNSNCNGSCPSGSTCQRRSGSNCYRCVSNTGSCPAGEYNQSNCQGACSGGQGCIPGSVAGCYRCSACQPAGTLIRKYTGCIMGCADSSGGESSCSCGGGTSSCGTPWEYLGPQPTANPPCCNGLNSGQVTRQSNQVNYDFIRDLIGLPYAYAMCPYSPPPYPISYDVEWRCR